MAQYVETKEVSFTITRPADTIAYSDADQIANSTTAGLVTPMRFEIGPKGCSCVISHFRLVRSGSTLANFNLSLFRGPTANVGDNVFLSETIADASLRIGNVSFWTSINVAGFVGGGLSYWGTVSPAVQQSRLFIPYLEDGFLYGNLMSQSAWTPVASETFTVIMTVERF